ncbi:uncharacterized protein LOC132720451 [Ruditapes philippinarum]|uniref:uncharacterized protein LOC132720451 n=1 Tax=Ruditapes philippinarum TaxID=129788 RepID=UPI00295B8132|nr:uncharacterized protein LOC132720451 [Ruditapes philippinarum]
MASVSLSKKLSNLRYNNWVKASLAVLITKEGIEPFVEEEIEQFQQKCLTDICNNQGLPSGTICTSCCTENVVKCPTNKICNVMHRKCRYHKDSATTFLLAGCPNKICHNFKTEIQKAHRYNGPSYKNTDATQWCSNSWEVAKCFMPPDGYKDAVSAPETDFNGVNSVIINCRCFQTKVTEDLSKNGNIFDKGRDIGKVVRHAPILEVDDKDLKQYFIYLDNLLSDTGHLISDNNAKLARKRLSELQNDTLLIGKDDVRKVLDDVAKIAQDKIKAQCDEFNRDAEKRKLNLIETTQKSLETLENKEKITLAELGKVLKSSIDEIEKLTKDSLQKINTETDKAVKKMKIESESGISLIHKATDESGYKILKESKAAMDQVKQTASEELKSISAANKQKEEDDYAAAKKTLQSELIVFYRESCSTINICPGLDEVDASLNDIYIPPYPLYSKETDTLKKVAKQSTEKKETRKGFPFVTMFQEQEETPDGKPVNSLQEIFYKQSKACSDIYLTAEPGLGKTSFVKWLSLNWCHARDPVKEDDHYFDHEEVSQLKQFDFVFVIFLREVNDQNINVDSMIRNTILTALGRQNEYTIEMIERVMCEERCLIVLDGLDEWNVSGIPKRPKRPSCTYITTSRPWKFCTISLNSKQIDQHVCIENVQKFCKEKFISSLMTMYEKRKCLRDDISDIPKACEEFIKVLDDKKVLHFYGTPVILAQLVYLWNMEKSIGNSQFEIYSDMADAIFSRAQYKCDLSKLKYTRSSQINYFQESLCETYYDLMIRLGKLAFNMLFSGEKGSSLVFDEVVTEKCLSGEDSNIIAGEMLGTCLKTGLLSKQPVYVKSRRKKYTYSFQHKTMQEYFAALYIQAEYDTNLEVMIVKKCNEVSKILEMGTVFMFLSGVNPNIAGNVFQSLQGTINEEKTIQEYRCKFSLLGAFEIQAIQNMKVNCALEGRNNGSEEFHLHLEDVIIVQSIQDDKYFDALKILVRQNALNLKSFMLEGKEIAEHVWTYFGIQEMPSLCTLNVGFSLFIPSNPGRLSFGIVDHVAESISKQLQSLYISSDLPETDCLLEKFLYFVKQQTLLRQMFLKFCTNDNIPKLSLCTMDMNAYLQEVSLENVPLSQLQLSEHLQQLTLANVPTLSNLQLNEHLQQLKLKNVHLSQLQLNEHLHELTLENVPALSHIQLNEHLQTLSMEHVPTLSQLQLNEHLHKLKLKQLPLSQLQLNKHLHHLTLENVPLTELKLNEYLQKATLENVPTLLSQLQLNAHLQQLKLKNIPLTLLQLNEHLHELTLENVPLSQLQLNRHLQQLELKKIPLLQLQLNEHLHQLTIQNVPISQQQMCEDVNGRILSYVSPENVENITGSLNSFPRNVESIDITGSLNSLEKCSLECLPGAAFTAVLNCLHVESKLRTLSCKRLVSAPFVLFSTLPKLSHLQMISLSSMDLSENLLELPCSDGFDFYLCDVTLTNIALYKLLSSKHNHNVRVEFQGVDVKDNTLEYELETSEQDGSKTTESCSSSSNIIKIVFLYVKISNKSFLRFVKLVEKYNGKVNLSIVLLKYAEIDANYREGIEYAKSLNSFIVTKGRYIGMVDTVEIIKIV